MWWIAIVVVVLAISYLRATGRAAAEPPPQGNLIIWVHRSAHLAILEADGEHSMVGQRISESLQGVLAMETPDGPVPLSREKVDAFPLTADQLWASAVGELARRETDFLPLGPGLFMCRTRDRLAPSRLLLHDRFLALGLGGAPVAIAPDEHVLVVADGADEAALSKLLTLAGQHFSGKEYRSLIPVVLEDGEWSDWEPTPALMTRVRDMRAQTILKDFLALGRGGISTEPCAHAAQTKDGLIAAWVEGTEVLLPKCDRLVLFDATESGPLHRVELGPEFLQILTFMHAERVPFIRRALPAQFPSKYARQFLINHAGQPKHAPNASTPGFDEVLTSAARPGGVLLSTGDEVLENADELDAQAMLPDGRVRKLTQAELEKLITVLPPSENARLEQQWLHELDEAPPSLTPEEVVLIGSWILGGSEAGTPEQLAMGARFALALQAEDRNEEARKLLEQVVSQEPTNAGFHTQLGVVLLAEGDRAKAREHFDRAIALDPTSAMPFAHRAESWLEELEYEKAQSDTARAAELATAADDFVSALHVGLLEQALEQATQSEEAASERPESKSDVSDPSLLVESGQRAALMPVLRPASYRHGSALNVRAMMATNGLGDAKVVTQEPLSWPLEDGIVTELVYDYGTRMVPLTMREAAGNLAHELKRIALTNLEAASIEPLEVMAPGVWRAGWIDGFRASRLLTPQLVHALGEQGPLIAFTPRYDTFILARRDDPAAVTKALELANEDVEELRDEYAWREALTATPWLLTEKGWTPWKVSENHSQYATFKALDQRLELARTASLQGLTQFTAQPAASA
ncbi:MAG: tetratricopeptide repeat protein [Archangium sp.]|nr:tetratricopeptide repeat protein [Archangium sp.]MDP3572564.1 tetratricopeptide repeat protein [Archangium sp.]